MSGTLRFLFFLFTLLHQLASSSAGPDSAVLQHNYSARHDRPYVNAVYFTQWGIYQRNCQPQDLPASDLSHVLYAFLNVAPNGEVYTEDRYADLEKHYDGDSWVEEGDNAYGCVKQLFVLKQAHRQLKVMLSIGGWSWSTNFPAVARTAESRATFARSAVATLRDWGFDGIDVDWEYPRDESEGADMVLLLRAVRESLDAYAATDASGHHFQLSIAAPAGREHYSKLPLAELGGLLDHIHLMAYDYAGSWSEYSGHAANLYPGPDPNSNPNSGHGSSTPYNTDEAVRAYVEAGVPSEKLVIGVPVYGRSFEATDGLGQSFSGVGAGEWEAGVWDYKSLPRTGAEVMCDETACACYSYNAATRVLTTFDTPRVTRRKASYVRVLSLGGLVYWEASGDRRDSGSLIKTGRRALGSLDETPNWLDYPNSIYQNIAGGMA